MSLKFSQLGARQAESDIARLMSMALERPELLSLAAGFTDTDSLPLAQMGEVARELGEKGDRSILQYGSNQGRPDLRAFMTSRLADQDLGGEGIALDSANSVITNGSQQALYLAVQTLCDPGDIVFVEQPTYFVFLEMLRGLGVDAIPMPMLDSGEVDVAGLSEELEGYRARCELDRVKALYLVSYYANPSGHSVSRSSKRAIVDLLSGFSGRIAIFEDAAYRELFFETPYEAESSVAFGAEKGVPIFYTTTLTKPFASGLKIGYGYCSHRDWLERMLSVKSQQDFGTAHYAQAVMARVFETGLFDEHLRRIRRAYRSKMEALHGALFEELPGLGWTWEKPEGGLYLWASAPEGVDTGFESTFHESAIDAGVMYVPGALCDAQRSIRNKVRLSFGVLDSDSLVEAARRFCRAARAI